MFADVLVRETWYNPSTIPGLLIWFVLIVAVVIIAAIAVKAMGYEPPPWLIQMGRVLLIAGVAIVAIRVLWLLFAAM